MIKIGHKIIAVPEREQYVRRLIERTGIDEGNVLWDTEHNGCMWNAIRAWKMALDSDCTHWCVMADDTDVVDNYMELEELCVRQFPDAIWTFFSNELSIKQKPESTPYIRLSGYNVRGIVFLMPKELVKGYVDLCEYMLSTYGFKRDDSTARIYALFNNIPVMTTLPNLARSYEIASTIGGHKPTRNSDAWQGYSVDRSQFLTGGYETIHTAYKSVLETHLKPDNPVNIKVR